MARVTPEQTERLTKLGRPPLDLRAEIFFAGHEELQKGFCDTPACEDGNCLCGKGMHHLPQYQKTGTYMHPEIVKYRLRVAEDRLARFKKMKMSDFERRTVAPAGITDLEAAVARAKKDMEAVTETKVWDEIKATGSEELVGAFKQFMESRFSKPEPNANRSPYEEPEQGPTTVVDISGAEGVTMTDTKKAMGLDVTSEQLKNIPITEMTVTPAVKRGKGRPKGIHTPIKKVKIEAEPEVAGEPSMVQKAAMASGGAGEFASNSFSI